MTGSPPTALRPKHPNPRSLHGLAETFEFEVRGDVDALEVTGVVSELVTASSPMRRSAVDVSPATTPSCRRMPYSR